MSFEPFAGEATVVPVRVGEEVHGLRVLEVRAPWTVRVVYDGVEHVIEVFGAGS